MIVANKRPVKNNSNFDLPGGIRRWTIQDMNATRFFVTDTVGPKWSSVISRTTYDMDYGFMIEDLKINDSLSRAFLTRKLPDGISHIRTILFYRGVDEDEECNNSA